MLIFTLAACGTTLAPYDAKKDLGEQINYTITGIDAGAKELCLQHKMRLKITI